MAKLIIRTDPSQNTKWQLATWLLPNWSGPLGTPSGSGGEPDGRPVIGATVRALHRHFDPGAPERHTNANLPGGPATTDQQGRFRFERLYAGAYTFEITAQGFPKTTVELVPAGKQDVEIVLRKPPE